MIKCMVCGKEFKQLNGHLKQHSLTPKEYCETYNVSSTLSDESRNKISDSVKKTGKHRTWTEEQRQQASIKFSERMKGNTPHNKLDTNKAQELFDNYIPGKIKVISYTNSTKVTYKCLSCNTEYTKAIHNIKSCYCAKCLKEPRKNTWNKISPEEFRTNFNKLVGDEYTLLSEYTKAEDKITIKHNTCGHIWDVTARQFYSVGSRCPHCAKLTSNQEKSLLDFIKSIYNGPIIENERTLIYPQELDIYLPEKKLAFEYNGTFWHSARYKDSKYHYNKSKACEEAGVRLIHIYEYEWFNERQRPILENIITGALGLNKTIYARKCNIVIKPSKEMRDFFNTNNIQGFRPGKFAICLEYEGRIVMAYMMGSAYFGKGKYEWEVIRGATELGINVVGGASKIWNYFIENYKPNTCVYYIDYNYFNGNSMKNLPNMQFIKTQVSFKNYFVDTKEVKNRNPYKHKEIAELYKEGKVIQIYNAGTKVYLWTNSEE